MESFLKVDIRSFSYANKENIELQNINFEVKKGEFIVLTGLSGCGKTTLLRIMNGLIPNFFEGRLDGEVILNGKNINNFPKGELARHMGNVFQNPQEQFFSTIAEDEIALVGENLGMEKTLLKDRVKAALTDLEIEDLYDKSVFEMSGGQRQKVAIASTLVYDTDIVIFDEPSASLDHKAAKDLGIALKKLKEMGKTVIVAEHRLYYLKGLIDRLIVMDDKTVAAQYGGDDLCYELRKKHNLRCFDEAELIRSCDYETLLSDIQKKCDGNCDECEISKDDLTVMNLNVQRKKRILAQDISFCIEKGECVGLLGKNGIGKSTLARQLVGLLPVKRGSTSYAGSRRGRLKKLFYLMQDPSCQLFADTVEYEVIPKNRLKDKKYLEKVRYYLKKMDLWDKRGKSPHELSVGEKLRLSLICAFLSGKDFIILDEPTAGLDYKRMDAVSDLIKKKSAEAPILLITHDTELLFKTCTSVILLTENSCKKLDTAVHGKEILDFIYDPA